MENIEASGQKLKAVCPEIMHDKRNLKNKCVETKVGVCDENVRNQMKESEFGYRKVNSENQHQNQHWNCSLVQVQRSFNIKSLTLHINILDAFVIPAASNVLGDCKMIIQPQSK